MIPDPDSPPRFPPGSSASGDASDRAGEAFVRRHARALLEFAGRLLGDAGAGVEATQAALLAALREQEEGSAAREELRDLKRRVVERARGRLAGDPRSRAIDALLPTFDAGGRRLGGPAPEWRAAADEDLRGTARRCIEELPDPHRAVLFLCDAEGVPVQECAAWLGLPVPLVHDTRHRARQALLALLEGSVALSRGPG